MKQGFTIWLLPVSISLLLHLAVILVVYYQPQHPAPARLDTLMVEMQTVSAKPVAPAISKPRSKPERRIGPAKQPESEAIPMPQALTTPQPSLSPDTVTTPVEVTETTNTNSQPDIQPLSKLTRPPAFLSKIDPVYPASEQRSGIQASVLAEITLDANGKLLEIKILKSAGSYFDNAVIEAIKQSTFTPGYIEKQAAAVRVLVPFRFKLK